jgi:DNA replication protein DnaC
VQTVDVLILDNFGMEKGSNKQKILVDVLKKRNESKLLTIITTRMTLKQLSDLYEESMDFLRYTMKDVSLAKSIKSDRNHIEKY